jgi:hypothetical protein
MWNQCSSIRIFLLFCLSCWKIHVLNQGYFGIFTRYINHYWFVQEYFLLFNVLMNSKITKIPPEVIKNKWPRVEVFRYFCFFIHNRITHVSLDARHWIHYIKGYLDLFTWCISLVITDLFWGIFIYLMF